MDTIVREIRHALRSLARSPGFTAVTVVTLALGIGANVAIFSVVDAVLLRPLPFPEPDELTTVWLHNPAQGIDEDITSYPSFLDWREGGSSFERMVGVRGLSVNLTGAAGEAGGEAEELRGAAVTEGFFSMLGVAPALGRGFSDREGVDGDTRVTVLSHELWTRRFGADRSILGRAIRLGGEPYRVVGVMPPGARFPEDAELWMPLSFDGPLQGLREARGALFLPVYGRLSDGVTLARAQAEMDAVAARLEERYPDANAGTGILLEPLAETVVGDVRQTLLVLLGAVALVLLIACANLANLLLARGAGHTRELAVRAALGAGGVGLARRVMVESLLLGFAGGALGLAGATAGVRALLALAPADLPRIAALGGPEAVGALGVSWPVFVFALAAALATGLLFGLLPALRAARVAPGEALRTGGAGSVGPGGPLGRARHAFVAVQFALALVLLAGAGLMVRSGVLLQRVDPGFEPRGVLSFRISLPSAEYPEGEPVRSFYRRLLESLEGAPGVESADAVSTLMLSRLPNSAPIAVEGATDVSEADANLPIPYDAVSPGFFRTLRIPLLDGRTFTAADRAGGTPVAVVNRALARRYFPEGRAVGGRLTFGDPSSDAEWIEVVGVVGDARRSGLEREARPSVYLPTGQWTPHRMTVVARTAGEPAALVPAVRRAVRELDPEQPVTEVRTLGEALARTGDTRRFATWLIGLFSVVAVALAAVGIYGVMAYAVGRSRREIGVRIALGAHPGQVARGVVARGMKLVVAGLAVGLAGAFALTRFLGTLLYGTGPTDPLTFALVVTALAGVALAANLLPARRAARTDPLTVLREE
jgi:putative ABC transport system permease protein